MIGRGRGAIGRKSGARVNWTSRRWKAAYFVAAIAGAAFWAPLLFFGTSIFLIESLLRGARAQASRVAEGASSEAKQAAASVLALAVVGVAACGVVVAVALIGWATGPGDVSAETGALCLALLVIRTITENVASGVSRAHGVPPPFSPEARAGLDDAVTALGATDVRGPVFGAIGPGEAKRLGSLASFAIIGALIAAITANSVTPQGIAAQVVRLFRGETGDEKEPASGPRSEDDANNAGPDQIVPSSQGTGASSEPSTVTAAEFCGGDPEGDVQSGPPADVAAAMVAAYLGEGAEEIGCPRQGVTEDDSNYIAKLSGGQSDPSWVIGHHDGTAAVVFEDLVPLAKRLRRNDVLGTVRPRQSTGGGDYQLFEKRDGSCILAVRNLYSQGYVVLPTPVTHTVMRFSIRRNAFPYVEDLDLSPGLVGHGVFRVSWVRNQGGQPVSKAVEMTKRTAPHLLRGVSAVIDRQKCPDPEAFDLLAAESREVAGAATAAAIIQAETASAI